MGAQLVSLAYARWARQCPDPAFRILCRMALTARDEPTPETPANLYFAGREPLVECLEYDPDRTEEASKKAVQRATTKLVKMGAIRRVNKAKAGEKQVYELTLWGPIRIDRPPVDNPGLGDTPRTPLGDTPRTPLGVTGCPEWGSPGDPPRNQEEPLRKLLEEQEDHLLPRATDAHARDEIRKPDVPNSNSPKCAQPTCASGYILTGDTIAHCPECNPTANVISIDSKRKRA